MSVLLDHICFSVYFMQQNELLLIRLKIHHLFEYNTTPFKFIHRLQFVFEIKKTINFYNQFFFFFYTETRAFLDFI